MFVISGCPRSGTSLMMRVMEKAFGPDRILGAREPQQENHKPELSEIQKYLFEKSGRAEQIRKREERAKAMNPNGYYEMAFCVQGVYYRPQFEDLLTEILDADKPKICKIVSQGLAQSEPRYIDKIVYMARDPRAVAKSQENLGRDNPMNPEDAPERDGEKVLIRSVEMFNQVTIAAARWLNRHPGIPVHVVNYDKLIDDPHTVLGGVAAFLGDGDFSEAANLIDPSLKRSKPEPVEGDEFALQLFDRLKTGDFAGVEEAVNQEAERRKANPPKPTQWFCPRLGQQVAEAMCQLCKTHIQTTTNLRANAERKEIKWQEEPCPYECGIQGDGGLTVAESVARNHWSALSPS